MVDSRFILLVSVGLMVLAPSPVACEVWVPGIIDALFPADDGVVPLTPTRGDRGARENLFCSGVRVLPVVKFAWLGRGGGCTDLDLAALELGKLRVESSPIKDALSIDVLADSPPLSAMRLGRLFWALREP